MQHFERPPVRELAIYQVRYLLILFGLIFWTGLTFIVPGIRVSRFLGEIDLLLFGFVVQTSFLLFLTYIFGIKNYRNLVTIGAVLNCLFISITRMTKPDGFEITTGFLLRILEQSTFDVVLMLIFLVTHYFEKSIPLRNIVFNKIAGLRFSKYLFYGYLGFSALGTTALLGTYAQVFIFDRLDSSKKLESEIYLRAAEKEQKKIESFIVKNCRSPNEKEEAKIRKNSVLEARKELESPASAKK